MREKLEALAKFEGKRLLKLKNALSALRFAKNVGKDEFHQALKNLNEGKDSGWKGLRKVDDKIIFEYGDCLIGTFEVEITTQDPDELDELLLMEHRKLDKFIDVTKETKAYFEYMMREHFEKKEEK